MAQMSRLRSIAAKTVSLKRWEEGLESKRGTPQYEQVAVVWRKLVASSPNRVDRFNESGCFPVLLFLAQAHIGHLLLQDLSHPPETFLLFHFGCSRWRLLHRALAARDADSCRSFGVMFCAFLPADLAADAAHLGHYPLPFRFGDGGQRATRRCFDYLQGMLGEVLLA